MYICLIVAQLFSLTDFWLFVLLAIEIGVEFSNYECVFSVHFCYIYIEAILSSTYRFQIVIYYC